MRILITGAKGRLGSRLNELLSPDHHITGLDQTELDITDYQNTRQAVRDYAPKLVLHCAAMTNVDGCAQNPDEAVRVNGYGTKNIALACREMDAAMLYVSSNE